MTTSRLQMHDVRLAYGERVVADALSLDLPDGALTAVVGPNACGKSTVLRALVRLLRPTAGRVTLDATDVARYGARAYARHVAYLPQEPIVPDGQRVRGLVARGRFPHQRPWAMWSEEDADAVDRAMDAAGVAELADRPVATLSGGQRQRVWVAMVLAQEADHLLLDEPTSFLDLRHQYDLLRLLVRLRDEGRTVVVVLHDLNQACRFADHLVVLRDGRVVAQGPPVDVVDGALVETVFGLPSLVVPDPVTGTPLVVPKA